MNECIRMEKKFEAGLDLTEQCKQMKKEAMAASLKRRPLPPAAFPKDHCWEQERRRPTPPWDPWNWDRKRKRQSARTCRERQGATSSCRNSSQESESAARKSSSCASSLGTASRTPAASAQHRPTEIAGDRKTFARESLGQTRQSARAGSTATWTPTGQTSRARRTATWTPTGQSARAGRTATGTPPQCRVPEPAGLPPKRQSARADGPGGEAPWQNEVRRSRACG